MFTWTEKQGENVYRTFMEDNNGKKIGRCCISVKGKVWTISEWFVDRNYMHQGYGKTILACCAKSLYRLHGLPVRVKYLWNGANEYVYDWMVKNFKAKCCCSVAELKTTEEDIWLAHEYDLSPACFVAYALNNASERK